MGFPRHVKLQFPFHLNFNWFGYMTRPHTGRSAPRGTVFFWGLEFGYKELFGVM